jgi:heme/copper-type cytochrome/quinol oxidase subunit 2
VSALACRLRCAIALGLLLGGAVSVQPALRAQDAGQRREFTIVARDHRFAPDVIEVQQDDLVRVTLRAEDTAHSFAIDEYRIAKRAGAGQSTTFEFRADAAGTFRFYCNLTTDDGCREMSGRLVVHPKR